MKREIHLCYLGEPIEGDKLGPPGQWPCHDWPGCLGLALAIAGALCAAHELATSQEGEGFSPGHALAPRFVMGEWRFPRVCECDPYFDGHRPDCPLLRD